MTKLGLAFLLLLPFALSSLPSTSSFSQVDGFSRPSLTLGISMPMSMPTASVPLVTSQPLLPANSIEPLVVNSLSASICGVNEVPNYQNLCIKPEYIEGCEIYKSYKTCYTCAKGYKLNSKEKCNYNALTTVTITHIKGCIRQTSSTQCETCAEGFYKNGNQCELGIAHCAKYAADKTCSECEADYSMVLSQCRHNNLLGCKYETKQHTCSECYFPFQLTNNLCDIPDCKILNDYGCVSCECGFYLAADRTCQPITAGCLRYQNGVCKDCLAHYKLKGGVCEIQGCTQYHGHYCQQCGPKYDLVDGQCKFKNCFDWLNDECIACDKGFVLKNGLCEQNTPTVCG